MNKQSCGDKSPYIVYCSKAGRASPAQISIIGKAERGITSPEYVLLTQNGTSRKGFQKKDSNEINENDLECVISRIGNILSVPTAEVIRTYEDPLLQIPHSIVSISVAQQDNEQFLSFSDMQDELFWDLSSGVISISPWIQNWIAICHRRKQNPEGIWELYATSREDCEASLRYPLEIANLWAVKHDIELIDLDSSIVKMVLFDIIIGQTDRGQGNYGVLVDWSLKTARLAPLFDNATLKKPGMDESLNGLNRLLVNRDLLAECAYNLWQDLFVSRASSFLQQESHVFSLLSHCRNELSEDTLCFLQGRISSAMNRLKQMITNTTTVAPTQPSTLFEDTLLNEVIIQVFKEHHLEPLQITRLGVMGFEPKYHVQTNSAAYLVKFSAYNRFYPELLGMMKTMSTRIPALSIPLFSVNHDGICRQVNIYTWFEGTSINELIHQLPERDCYLLGVRCGDILQNIHNNKQNEIIETYSLANNLAQSMRVLFDRPDLLTQRDKYLPQMHIWMKKLIRPHKPSLVHMDYVPKNLVATNDSIYVIDWDSCEISDPWLDFFEKGLALYPERQAFNAGIIDGYFGGNVPSDFWDYFMALTVFALVRTSTWTANLDNPSYISMIEQHVCNSYEGFTKSVPSWYAQYSPMNRDSLDPCHDFFG